MKTKKIHIAIIIGIALGNITSAFADSGSGRLPGFEITDCFASSPTVDLTENCYTKTSRCYCNAVVYSCQSCNSNANQTTKYTTLNDCQGTVEYTT